MSNFTDSSGPKRRAVPRYDFIATAELRDPVNEIQLSGRVTEISRKGCYVDILNTLPVGTALSLEVSHDQGRFVAKGTIIYAHPGLGMGVAFLDPTEEQLMLLDSWLSALPSTTAL
jgi:PilZ domain